MLRPSAAVRNRAKKETKNISWSLCARHLNIRCGHYIGEPAFGECRIAFHAGSGWAAQRFQLGKQEIAELALMAMDEAEELIIVIGSFAFDQVPGRVGSGQEPASE